MRNYIPAKKRVAVSAEEWVRIIRQLQGHTQAQLSELCGIPQTTLSVIETGRVILGAKRTKSLTNALHCHRAVLVFAGWQVAA